MKGVQNPATGLGLFVREGRERLGLSLRQAAEKWQLDKSELSRIESRERVNPGGQTLLKLAHGLGVTVDELLRNGNTPPLSKETPRPVDGTREDTKSRPRSGRRESGKRIATT